MKHESFISESGEISQRLDILWKAFSFKGAPPLPNSPVEKRLFDTCDKYTNILIDPQISRLPSSNSTRRELHNQIALMVTGKQRTTMSDEQAEMIADFACRFSKGYSLEEAI